MQSQHPVTLNQFEADPSIKIMQMRHDSSTPLSGHDAISSNGRVIVDGEDRLVQSQFAEDRATEHVERMDSIVERQDNDPRYLGLGQRVLALMNGQSQQNKQDSQYLDAVGSPNLKTSDEFIEQASRDRSSLAERTQAAELEQRTLLLALRLQIMAYTPEQATYLNNLLDVDPQIPPFLKNSKPDNYNWDQWFVDSERGASDGQLVNFLQWHNQRLATYNVDSSRNWGEQMKATHVAASSQLIELGVFESVTEIEERLEGTSVKIASVFDMARRKALGERIGNTVYVGHAEYDASTAHELNHILLDGDNFDGLDQLGRNWLSESVIEQVAQAQTGNRNINDTEPGTEPERQAERQFMHELIAQSKGGLQFSDFAKACVDGDRGYQSLKLKVTGVYGLDILGKHESRVRKLVEDFSQNIGRVDSDVFSKTMELLCRDSAASIMPAVS